MFVECFISNRHPAGQSTYQVLDHCSSQPEKTQSNICYKWSWVHRVSLSTNKHKEKWYPGSSNSRNSVKPLHWDSRCCQPLLTEWPDIVSLIHIFRAYNVTEMATTYLKIYFNSLVTFLCVKQSEERPNLNTFGAFSSVSPSISTVDLVLLAAQEKLGQDAAHAQSPDSHDWPEP